MAGRGEEGDDGGCTHDSKLLEMQGQGLQVTNVVGRDCQSTDSPLRLHAAYPGSLLMIRPGVKVGMKNEEGLRIEDVGTSI